MKQAIIKAILTGRQEAFGPQGGANAYRKKPTAGPLAVTAAGLQGDEQADRRHHGGIDKALLHYNHDHYAAWLAERLQLAGRLWRECLQRRFYRR